MWTLGPKVPAWESCQIVLRVAKGGKGGGINCSCYWQESTVVAADGLRD